MVHGSSRSYPKADLDDTKAAIVPQLQAILAKLQCAPVDRPTAIACTKIEEAIHWLTAPATPVPVTTDKPSPEVTSPSNSTPDTPPTQLAAPEPPAPKTE